MADTSKNLRFTAQSTNDNPNTWGAVANNSVFKMLEDAIVKRVQLDTLGLGTAITMDYGDGQALANDARAMMLDVFTSGAEPGGTVTLTVPVEGAGAFGNADEYGKIYLVRNQLAAQDVDVTVLAGTPVTIPFGEARLVFVDSTDAFLVNAGTVTQADLATKADFLLSDSGAAAPDDYITGESFVRVDLGVGTSKVQEFTKGQNVVRSTLDTSGAVTVNNGDSNAFVISLTGNITLSNPNTLANADGQVIRFTFIQPTAGGPYDITWGSNYFFPAGARPGLTQVADAVDYAAFEYVSDYPGGGRWVGNIILDVR